GLLADLDAVKYAKREAALRELAKIGDQADPVVRQALQSGPPLEVKIRLEAVLEKIEAIALPLETLQTLRAVEALEHIGTAEARQLLGVLAQGAAPERLTQSATASLQRLAKRPLAKL